MTTEDALRDIKLSIHELETRLNKLEKDSQPPVFNEECYEVVDARLQVMEAFFNGIKLITTNKEELE